MSMDGAEELPRDTITTETIDRVLVAQLVVAWAGEGGEEPRMGWWRCDLLSEFGGEDLFKRLMPHTWQWGLLRAVREAARRREAALVRERHHDPDRLLSLFNLGFAVDERIDERLTEFERAGKHRVEVLPELDEMITLGWDRERFFAWIRKHATVKYEVAPAGRRLRSKLPTTLEQRVRALIGGLAPLADSYPLPHFVLAEGAST